MPWRSRREENVAEKPHRSFGKNLNGQDWRLDLHGTPDWLLPYLAGGDS